MSTEEEDIAAAEEKRLADEEVATDKEDKGKEETGDYWN